MVKIEAECLVQVHGHPPLRGVAFREFWLVKNLGDGTYGFFRPRGKKMILRHYADGVDRCVRPAGHGDRNKLTAMKG